MATADADVRNDGAPPSNAADVSAIVRQMVELVDAMTGSEAESATSMHDITTFLEILSRAWPSSASSTDASNWQSTPSEAVDSCGPPEIAHTESRFEIRRLLGHGGFGVVLLAFDHRLGREVALKVPRPEILVSHNMRQRFLREAQATAALDHPNIVPVFDTGEIGPIWFIASRYVAGPTLAEWLRTRQTPISFQVAAELVAILAEAVQHAHSRGVLHRDLKPANVLLEPNDDQINRALPFSPRLSDFGLARRIDDDEQFTKHEALIGTPRYMAPEQASGQHKEVGIQTDVYGLGVILYELLVGNPPHTSDSELETLRRILEEPVAIAPLRDRRIPSDLQTICLKCLEKDQPRRYETAGALAADLRRFLGGEPVEARPVNLVGRLQRWCRRRPWQAALSAALCFVSIAGLAGITWQWIRAERGLVLARNEATRAEDNLRQLEGAFVDLAWMFEEGDLWTGSDETFTNLLQGKLHRYAEDMFPQYLASKQAPKPILAAFHAMTARSQSVKGQSEAAEENYHKSIELWRQVLQQNPNVAEHSRAFAITLSGYYTHLVNSGRVAQATEDFQVAQQMFQRLKLPPDDEIQAREVYAHFMTNVGYARARRGRNPYAIEAFEFSRQMWHELTQRSPKASYLVMESTMLTAIAGRLHRDLGDLRGALDKGQQARRLMEEVVRLEPARRDYLLLLASTLRYEAYYTSRSQDTFPAVSLYERSINIYRESMQSLPVESPEREAFGGVNLDLAQLLRDTRNLKAALPYYEACAENWETLLSIDELSKESEDRLAMVYCRIGEIHGQDGHSREAIAAFQASIELAKKIRGSPNATRKATTALIQSNIQLSCLLQQAGQLPEALNCARQAVVLLEEQTATKPKNLNFKKELEDAQATLRELEASDGGKRVRVAGVVLKWLRTEKEANYERAEKLIAAAARGGAQLVCTTECFLDGYAIKDKTIPLDEYRALGEPIPDGKYYQRLAALADRLDIHLVAGMLEADNDQRYNTAVFIDPNGKLMGKYRKHKLDHELVRNTPGTETPVFRTPFGQIGIMICADRRDPDLVKRLRDGGAEILICPSGGMFGPKSNDPIVQARSKENEVPILFVHPAEFLVTDSRGEIRARTILGDRLEITTSEIGGDNDKNEVFFFEMPLAAERN